MFHHVPHRHGSHEGALGSCIIPEAAVQVPLLDPQAFKVLHLHGIHSRAHEKLITWAGWVTWSVWSSPGPGETLGESGRRSECGSGQKQHGASQRHSSRRQVLEGDRDDGLHGLALCKWNADSPVLNRTGLLHKSYLSMTLPEVTMKPAFRHFV